VAGTPGKVRHPWQSQTPIISKSPAKSDTHDRGGRRGAEPETHNLGVTARGQGNRRGHIWQEHVFSGSERAKCETRQRHGSNGEVDPQRPSGNHAAFGFADTALCEHFSATAHPVKPMPARPGRGVGKSDTRPAARWNQRPKLSAQSTQDSRRTQTFQNRAQLLRDRPLPVALHLPPGPVEDSHAA